jgi:alkanesulfonate monooxygenase SsuD/methylene tetrahydromethanopterin reductase-like flavin-dependent oxidoreductase (luciferase family)
MSFGVFLAPYHPLGDSPIVTYRRDLEIIQRCDELGFDEAWVGEHHSAAWESIADPAVFLAAAGERTQRIRLGSGVVSLPYHQPRMVADRFVTLDYLTNGRAMLGVGPGALVSDDRADLGGIRANHRFGHQIRLTSAEGSDQSGAVDVRPRPGRSAPPGSAGRRGRLPAWRRAARRRTAAGAGGRTAGGASARRRGDG